MRPAIVFFAFAILPCAATAATPLYEPSLSPDHLEIAFVSGGDIWTVPSTGGEARLLVSHPATESRPLYSPDGTRLAFISNRTGNGDIYVLHLRTGELKRITYDDARCGLDAWSPDGKYLYFSSNRGDIGNMADIYRIPADGGTAVAVAADRYTDESQAAPNPVNGTLAFTSGSMAVTQWWRKGRAHIDETRFTLLEPSAAASAAPKYQPFLDNHAKNLWPMWSADGRSLLYVSDQSGAENIWEKSPSGNPRPLTKFTDGHVLFPSVSRDGKAIVFERNFRIWKLDPATGSSAPLEIAVRGIPAAASATHLTLTTGFRDLALSPDGKKVAFIAHGEVFAASAKDAGNATRLTSTPANESQIAWSPDSKRLVYVSDREGPGHLYLYDLTKDTETPLTTGPLQDSGPAWSPDGAGVAFIRDGREIHVLKPNSKTDLTVVSKKLRILTSVFRDDGASPVSWSPDGSWLAFFSSDSRGFSNVAVVPAAGGEEKPLSFLSNAFGSDIVWSPDRNWILFGTSQRTERRSIARVDLIPRTPRFSEDQFRDLFSPEPPSKQPKPVQIVFEGIRRRLTLLGLGIDAESQVISPDGKTLLFTATSGGQENLFTYSLDELAKEPAVPRQLTSTPGIKANAQFSPDGKEVFYLDAGKLTAIPIETRAARPLAVTAELDVNFDEEKKEVLHQAWTILNETYYDPKFHGANWADVRGQYAEWIEGSRTADEMRRVIGLMIGELNSSHSGIAADPQAAPKPVTGRIGLTVDPADNTILTVTPLGPADVAGIKPGEKLLSVDGKALTPATNLDQLLQYKIGKRTAVVTSAVTSGGKDIAVLPINNAAEKGLIYRQWVEDRRAYVNKISNGRLGYVHMLNMSAEALDQLYLDLDSENQSREGVVIDIRNNTGGFVNSYALDVFTRRGYLTMTPRDRLSASARSMNGQRALERPTVLVVNQNSLSDAEDFTEGYRTLKLGKVVGEPTAGWIIYTGSAQLIDGSTLRTPSTRITANDGTDMELHPRPVDLTVDRAVGESYSGRDAQLDAAVQDLLATIGKTSRQ